MEAKDRAHKMRQRVVAKVGRHIRHAQALPRHQLHGLHQHRTGVIEGHHQHCTVLLNRSNTHDS